MSPHLFSEIVWGSEVYGIHVEPDGQWCILPARHGYANAQAIFRNLRGVTSRVVHFTDLKLDPKLEWPSSQETGDSVVVLGATGVIS